MSIAYHPLWKTAALNPILKSRLMGILEVARGGTASGLAFDTASLTLPAFKAARAFSENPECLSRTPRARSMFASMSGLGSSADAPLTFVA